MEENFKKSLKTEYVDPNEGNTSPKIPDGVWSWCFARIREPSTAMGLAVALGSIGINLEPAKASAILMIALGIGGFLGFVMRDKKNLIHEGGNPKIDINWGLIKGWFLARLAEPSSRIGILMVVAAFGIKITDAQLGMILSALMFLGGSAAVVHEEGDRRGKLL